MVWKDMQSHDYGNEPGYLPSPELRLASWDKKAGITYVSHPAKNPIFIDIKETSKRTYEH